MLNCFSFLLLPLFLVSERILARDPLDEIKRAFQLFDDDNTGKISLRNLRRVARDLGDKLDDEELYVACLAYMCDLTLTIHQCFLQTSYDR